MFAAEDNAETISHEIARLETELIQREFSSFWSHARDIRRLLKTLAVSRAQRKQLQSDFNTIYEEAIAQRKEHEEAARAAAAELEAQITNLAEQLTFPRDHQQPPSAFWSEAKEIAGSFKTNRLLGRHDRARLWETLQSVYDKAKHLRRRVETDSGQKKEIIHNRLSDIRSAEWANSFDEIWKAENSLNDLFQLLKDGWGDGHVANQVAQSVGLLGSGHLLANDRKECWDRLQEVRSTLASRKAELQSLARSRALVAAQEAYSEASRGDPYEARSQVIKLQRTLRDRGLTRNDAEDVRRVLQDAFEQAKSRIDDRKAASDQQWVEKQLAFIAHQEECIESLESKISNHEHHIEKNQDQLDSAQSDDFADMVRGWIDEHQEAIERLRGFIAEHERKIESAREKLRAR